jgi:hypothetical protein
LAYRNCLGTICFLALIAIVGIIIVVSIVAIVIVTSSHGHDVLAIIITFDTFAINCIVFVHCAGGSIGIIIIAAALGVVHSYVATHRNWEVA